MAKNIHITIADQVYEEIVHYMKVEEKTNKSEFVEELLRWGMMIYKDRLKQKGR